MFETKREITHQRAPIVIGAVVTVVSAILPLLAGLTAVTAASTAMAAPASQDAVVRVDTHEVLERARDAQEDFEALRRRRLPWGYGSPGECDEHIGRYCFWYPRDDAWDPEPEDHEVIRARVRLIVHLDSAVRLFPANDWVTGQLVRYLIEAHRFSEALTVTRDCSSTGWWCHALAGYTLHRGGAFADADTAFTAALETMPDEQRCAWIDLNLVVSPDLRGDYKKLTCGQREELNRRVWWLADPLYLTPGNERRTEHYTRLVIDRLMVGSAHVRSSKWGDDDREYLMRYGWPVHWTRERVAPGAIVTQPNIVSYEAKGGRTFLPEKAVLESPLTAEPNEWTLESDRPRSLYAPMYATDFRSLDPVLTVFGRGDSVIVIAAFDVAGLGIDARDRTVLPPSPEVIDAGAAVTAHAEGLPYLGARTSRDRTVVLRVTAPRERAIVSVEAVNRRDSVAARQRRGVDLPDRTPTTALLSELLLLAPTERQVRVLHEAVPLARGSDRYRPGEPVTVFWELYGPTPSPPRLSLVVERQGKGLFRKIGEALGVTDSDPDRVSLAWEEPAPLGPGVTGRTVTIRLPEEREGRFRVRLEARVPGGADGRTDRVVVVEK